MTIETFSINAEQSLIGGLIIEAWRIDDLPCSAVDFYRYEHKTIFEAIQRMVEKNQQVDIITLAERLENNGKLDEIGGLKYLSELAMTSAGPGNAKRYAEIIREKAIIRNLISTANDIADKCVHSGESADELLEHAESTIMAIGESRDTNEPVHIATAVLEAADRLGNVIDGVTYQTTGLIDLDEYLGGLVGGRVYVVAARPGMGKTGLLCSIAHRVQQDGYCFIASLEMERHEIAQRLIAIDGRVNLGSCKNWDDEDYNRFTKGAAIVKDMKIIIDHTSGLTMGQLRSRTRRAKRKHGLSCIFVDYLQLMRAKAESREREIATISAEIKSLAKELDVPIILLAQLNRDCEKRHDKRPLLSDLRESGAIEQDADVILMLYRDEVYDSNSQLKGMAEILIRKNRQGRIGEVFTQFNAETMHFRNKAHDWMLPQVEVKPTRSTRGLD